MSPASVMRSMTAGASYPPSKKMYIVQHQLYISRAPKPSQGALLQAAGLGAEGEIGRFGRTLMLTGSEVRVHPP